jgi:hypothetical protein
MGQSRKLQLEKLNKKLVKYMVLKDLKFGILNFCSLGIFTALFRNL